MNILDIIISRLPVGYYDFERHFTNLKGGALDKAESKIVLKGYKDLCAKHQLVFLNNRIKPLMLTGSSLNLYSKFSGSFNAFNKAVFLNAPKGFKPKYKKYLFEVWNVAIKNQRFKNEDLGAWSKLSPMQLKEKLLHSATSNKKTGKFISDYHTFHFNKEVKQVNKMFSYGEISQSKRDELIKQLEHKRLLLIDHIKNETHTTLNRINAGSFVSLLDNANDYHFEITASRNLTAAPTKQRHSIDGYK